MLNRTFPRLRPLVAASVLLSYALLPARTAQGWGPGGHMMVAKIAFDRLNPRAKAEAAKLIALPINPAGETKKSLDFVTAAVWADDVKRLSGFEFSGDEHFADFPFSVDGTKVPTNLPKEANVIRALGRYVDVLKTSPDQNERAEALRFIIHYVGDIHQPLHCSTRVSKSQKKGDEGGNAFMVKVAGGGGQVNSVKLHSFWDGGLNNFPKGGPPPEFKPPALSKIDAAVPGVLKENPDTNKVLKLDDPTNYQAWADESSFLAQKYAYDGLAPNGTPTKKYQQSGVRMARKRVAWAGYRLAALLNSVWPE